MTTYTNPHSLPVLEPTDKIAASDDGLRQDLNAVSLAAAAAITAEGGRAETAANAYADGKDTSNRAAWAAADATNLASAKTYADSGDATNLAAAKTYADGKDTSNRTAWAAADVTNLAAAATDAAAKYSPKAVILADGTDIDTLRTSGTFVVASAASAATMINLPFNVPGEIVVSKAPGSTLVTQHGIGIPLSNGNISLFTRTTRAAQSWDTTWKSDRQIQGIVPDGTDLNTLRVPGTYLISSATSAATMTNMPTINGAPVNNSAVIDVVTFPGTSTGQHKIEIYQSDGTYARFSRITRSASSWPTWQYHAAGSAPAPTLDPLRRAGGRHAQLQQMAYARRGALGVQGKAVVSLRFDHWLNAMRATVIPLLEKYMLCGSLCLNADNMGIDQNLGTTWAQVTDMALHKGVEIWNHGADHLDHTDEAGIIDTIVGGQQRLQAAVGPKLVVDGWMSNGSSYYDNFNFGRGFPAWTETVAAEAIRNSHAFSDGKNTGYLQPLDGRIKLGGSHYSAESGGSAPAIARIEEAKKNGRGITVYFHPGSIDQPGGFVLSDLEVLLAYIAAERDAGRIEVLTVSGMAVADSTHSRREDLLTNRQFADGAAGWGVGAGWTFRTEGGKQLASASATAGSLYQNVSLVTNFGWAMGGMCELVVPARASGGVASQLRLQVHDTTDDTQLKTTRVFDLPADGSTKPYRIFATMPAELNTVTGSFVTTSVRATFTHESGGAFDLMDEPHLRPV
ncbi:polysaccharide deacetylase family protein [Arthrobacter sp. 18067]|uniref:polysaccharide deacetylase family protein n=1 Tax=Arthrobacter sp. 18067 TaxID=2681413 RepID=UPI001359AEE2|nr:polysaccharide deacetylase family protein [Arthrobacter sp. 18067]